MRKKICAKTPINQTSEMNANGKFWTDLSTSAKILLTAVPIVSNCSVEFCSVCGRASLLTALVTLRVARLRTARYSDSLLDNRTNGDTVQSQRVVRRRQVCSPVGVLDRALCRVRRRRYTV